MDDEKTRKKYIKKHPIWKEFYDLMDDVENQSKDFNQLLSELLDFSEKLLEEILNENIDTNEVVVLESAMDYILAYNPKKFYDELYSEVSDLYDSYMFSEENEIEDIKTQLKRIKEFKKKWKKNNELNQ